MKRKKSFTKDRSGQVKNYVALARVSSREQEREGFSLDVQVDALQNYANRQGGKIVKLYRIAETASKTDERTTFKELIVFAKQNAEKLDGLLFYKVDRAARNLFDYVELERIETDYQIPFISVSQPTENTPAGRMQRRVLASMASFYTEQQSIDVQQGIERRVQSGLFSGLAPYGYRNVRVDGRSIVEIDQEQAKKVRYIFDLYAHHNCTLDSIVKRLADEQINYTGAQPHWLRCKIHNILRDRSYLGELRFRGEWREGKHEPLVARVVWNRVQSLLGESVYKAHEMTFGSELIACGHCGSPITGERIVKKATGREYVYYRCSKYNHAGHPRVRVREADLDQQVVAMFDRIKQPEPVRDWFYKTLRLWMQDDQQNSRATANDIQREMSDVRQQQDRLLNLRLLDEIESDTFSHKSAELRDRIANLTLQLDSAHRGRDEQAQFVERVFELSQNLKVRWVAAEYPEKREIMQMFCLNFSLNGETLCPTMRKPFDVLVEGLAVSSSRGDKI